MRRVLAESLSGERATWRGARVAVTAVGAGGGSETRGISSPPGSTSSPSAALQSSLASRLRRRLDAAGSTLFKLT